MAGKRITTIQVTRELRDFLVKQAIKKNESYDEIIKRLLKKLWGATVEREEITIK